MKIFSKIITQIFLWIFTVFVLISLLVLPRQIDFKTGEGNTFEDARFSYSLSNHYHHLKDFILFVKDHPDLGPYDFYSSTLEHVTMKMKKSLIIIMPALLLGYFGGILKGIYDFWSQDKKGKLLGKSFTWLFLSIPDLFVIISIQLSIIALYSAGIIPKIHLFSADTLDRYIMCILFLAIYPFFYVANITYTSLQGEEGKDYIRTAKAKGTKSLKILYVHVLKNSWPMILSQSNTVILYILSNLFIVEKLSGFQGAGYYFFIAVATPPNFTLGSNFYIQPTEAFAYIIFFTFLIFLSNTISNICRSIVTPYRKENRL